MISDIRMPEMDGWQLAAHLKATNPHIPVLFVSGYSVHLGSFTLPGPALGKPFKPAELVERVRSLLLGSQPHVEGDRQ